MKAESELGFSMTYETRAIEAETKSGGNFHFRVPRPSLQVTQLATATLSTSMDGRSFELVRRCFSLQIDYLQR